MNDIQNTLDKIVKDDWRRPDLYDGREVPRQKDMLELTKPDGERFGLMEVDNYPLVAVTRCMYFTEKVFEKQYSVSNVPPILGIICVEGKGGYDWRSHDHSFTLSNGSCTLVNLHRPDDGHSHFYHEHTDLISRHVFVPHIFIHQKAEQYPDLLEAVSRMVEGFTADASQDIRRQTADPVYQNALAAIFAQPLLGNTSEEYVSDNLVTLLSALSDNPRPASLDKIDYDAVLRQKVLAARDIIEADIKSPFSLRSLALAVGTNENYLKAGFRHEFGQTVFGYLFECRIQAARRLLLDPELTIDRVALAVGYTDPFSFYRPFRRRFGITPTQYRISATRDLSLTPPPITCCKLIIYQYT